MVVDKWLADVYLEMDFKENDQAKALGAKFDPAAKKW